MADTENINPSAKGFTAAHMWNRKTCQETVNRPSGQDVLDPPQDSPQKEWRRDGKVTNLSVRISPDWRHRRKAKPNKFWPNRSLSNRG